MKRYCECFQSGVRCHEKCKCTDCRNPAGVKINSQPTPATAPLLRTDSAGSGTPPVDGNKSPSQLRVPRPREEHASSPASVDDLIAAAGKVAAAEPDTAGPGTAEPPTAQAGAAVEAAPRAAHVGGEPPRMGLPTPAPGGNIDVNAIMPRELRLVPTPPEELRVRPEPAPVAPAPLTVAVDH